MYIQIPATSTCSSLFGSYKYRPHVMDFIKNIGLVKKSQWQVHVHYKAIWDVKIPRHILNENNCILSIDVVASCQKVQKSDSQFSMSNDPSLFIKEHIFDNFNFKTLFKGPIFDGSTPCINTIFSSLLNLILYPSHGMLTTHTGIDCLSIF